MTRPDLTSAIAADDLAKLLRARERRAFLIVGCIGAFVVLATLLGAWFIAGSARDVGEVEDRADAAQTKAELTQDQIARLTRDLTNKVQVALIRSDRTLACLTKSKKPAQCLDIAAGAPGRDGGIGKDGRPGAQGLRGQTGQRGAQGPAGRQGVAGRDGAPGRAPTASEIAAAVSAYCSGGACRGPAGADGENTSVSPSQVAQAVAEYCAARGDCVGAQGPQGAPGADSTVQGPPGPQGPPGSSCPATAVVTNQDGSQITVCVPA